MAVEKFTDLPLAVPVAADLACIVTVPGDISSKATVTSLVPAASVSYAKIQNISAASKLLGRGSASGAGSTEEITLGTNLTMSGTTLNAADTDTGITQLTTDVTAGPGNGSQVATIANNAVTYAKMQDASAGNVFLARVNAASGDYSELAIGASQLAGRGPAGTVAAITLGTNLTISGTTLNTVGGTASGVQNGYRLTLTTGLPVTTAEIIGAGTIYWTPYKGASCPLYTGAGWIEYVGGQLSLSLTGLLTSGSVYDVFVNYNSGSPALTVLVWTNTTTRATALAYQDGWLVKSGTPTQFYVGTIRASGTDTTEDSGGGVTTQVGGKRYVWNYYNRVRRNIDFIDTTDTWSYNSTTYRQWNAAAGNQVDFVVGVQEDIIEGYMQQNGVGGASIAGSIAFGLDSTTVPTGLVSNWSSAGQNGAAVAHYSGFPGLGAHALVALEGGNGTTTFNRYGDNGGNKMQSGVHCTMWA